ncbi:hypothetical protein [Paratractidigestivibacter sp.]|uniref:hypothetical protein n=1 Tax=Paratractidigestivibacter sp. TaxID=2847316 RepID=UPI002ABE4D9C|nr:hypothetical protein [Paratractidigestivibacter sp.]
MFSLSSDGEKTTECFSFWRGTPAAANVNLGAPSVCSTEVLGDSEFLCCEASDLLCAASSNASVMKAWNDIVLATLEFQMEYRNVLQVCDNRGRYLWFLKSYPGAIYKVRHYQVASFLGMTPVTLSRVRAKVAKEQLDLEAEPQLDEGLPLVSRWLLLRQHFQII